MRPDAAIAPARPAVGLRFLLEPPDPRLHGIFLFTDTDDVIDTVSESFIPWGAREELDSTLKDGESAALADGIASISAMVGKLVTVGVWSDFGDSTRTVVRKGISASCPSELIDVFEGSRIDCVDSAFWTRDLEENFRLIMFSIPFETEASAGNPGA